MKAKLLFLLINTALYPLYVFLLSGIVRQMSFGGDAAGAGMDCAFTFIHYGIYGAVILCIASTIAAHKIIHCWWIGLLPGGFWLLWGLTA